jgi:hypothetical protein
MIRQVIHVNPGLLSFLLISIAMILFASGWKEELARGISHKVILLFFVCWIFFSFFHIPFFAGYQVNLTYLVLAALIGSILVSCASLSQSVQLLSLGLLLGSVYFLLWQLYSIDPVMIIYRPTIDISITLSIIAALMIRHPLHQIAALSIGLTVGDGLFHWFQHGMGPVVLGGPLFQDQWWLTVMSTRLLSETCSYLFKGCKGAAQLWCERRKEWRR